MFFLIPEDKRVLIFYILVILTGILLEYLDIIATLKKEVEDKLREVACHPDLVSLFSEGDQILCEQDLLAPNGPTLRPDRINFSSTGEATVLDYKTGIPKNGNSAATDP